MILINFQEQAKSVTTIDLNIVQQRAIKNGEKDLSLLIGKSYFSDDGSQKCLKILTNFKHFHNASWPCAKNCSMGI